MIEKIKNIYKTWCQFLESEIFNKDHIVISEIIKKLKKFLIPDEIADRKTYIIFSSIFEQNPVGIDKLLKKNKHLLIETFKVIFSFLNSLFLI